eukprot:gene23961-biopygen9741
MKALATFRLCPAEAGRSRNVTIKGSGRVRHPTYRFSMCSPIWECPTKFATPAIMEASPRIIAMTTREPIMRTWYFRMLVILDYSVM